MGILEQQLALQREAFGVDPATLEGEDVVHYIRWNALALIVELVEALQDGVNWKPWKSSDGPWKNRIKFAEELADVDHFIANLWLVLGYNDLDRETEYTLQHNKNRRRREEGLIIETGPESSRVNLDDGGSRLGG